MNRTLRLVFGLSVVLLLTATAISAQGPRDQRDRDLRENHTRPGGFEGMRGNMNITGEVNIEESIIISLHVQPSDEIIEQILNNPRGHDLNIENLTNTIDISVYALVEYLDFDDNGYTNNDTVVSEILLNSDLLLDPVMSQGENGTEYLITSVDDTFTMYLYLNEDDGTIHTWKWSVEINYPFVQDNTELAILQSINSNKAPLTRDRMQHQDAETREGLVETRHLRDEHPRMPMFFKWDPTAQVDGVTENVTASRAIVNLSPVIALSIPQGDQIFYDPEIGVEIENLDDVQNLIDDATLVLGDIVRSPTIIGLVIGSLVLLGAYMVTRYR